MIYVSGIGLLVPQRQEQKKKKNLTLKRRYIEQLTKAKTEKGYKPRDRTDHRISRPADRVQSIDRKLLTFCL